MPADIVLRWNNPLYFCCCKGTGEERGTVLYPEDCARQAGPDARFIYIEDVGLGGVLTDLDDNVIHQTFKRYPLKWMMRDENG